MNGRVPEQEVQDIELHDVGEEKEEESQLDVEDPLNPEVTRTPEVSCFKKSKVKVMLI